MNKGNIVRSKRAGRDGIVLAVRKDGTAVKVYDYGTGHTVWVPIAGVTVTIDDDRTCGKCGGSGVFDNGVVRGVCFGCEGTGSQNNEDRLRNHHYWHRQGEIDDALLAIERGEEPTPLSSPARHAKATPEDVQIEGSRNRSLSTFGQCVSVNVIRAPRSCRMPTSLTSCAIRVSASVTTSARIAAPATATTCRACDEPHQAH